MVRIAGLDELDRALAAIPQNLRRPVLIRALRSGSKGMVKQARATAPRGTDPSRRGSKKDRRSGRSKTLGPGADSIRARAVPAASQYRVDVAVGPDRRHFYMRFSEFGTSRQAGQRYMTKAFEANKADAIVKTAEELAVVIQNTAAKLRRDAQSGKLGARDERALRP